MLTLLTIICYFFEDIEFPTEKLERMSGEGAADEDAVAVSVLRSIRDNLGRFGQAARKV